MHLYDLKLFVTPIILIAFGLFIKKTKNENYQNVKSWWKVLFILGLVLLALNISNLFI